MSSGQAGEVERAEAKPLEGEHFAALAREHAAHLVILSLGQGVLGFARAGGGTAGEFGAFMREENVRWTKAVKDSAIRLD